MSHLRHIPKEPQNIKFTRLFCRSRHISQSQQTSDSKHAGEFMISTQLLALGLIVLGTESWAPHEPIPPSERQDLTCGVGRRGSDSSK